MPNVIIFLYCVCSFRRQLQLPRGPVPHEAVGELSPDPELPPFDPDRCRFLGLLLDGHRVRAGENQPRGHHATGGVVTGGTR